MGQCVSRDHPGAYAFSRHYDADSLASSVSGHAKRGHSESKGAKKREKSAGGNGNGKPSRGIATSFGFRRRPASTSRADDNARRKQKSHDKNGNGGSTEDLRPEEVLSGRSTPLARPRKETAGQPLRTNRFGFRQPHSKTAKVADVSVAAESAFNAPLKDKETAMNNNALDKKSTNSSYNNQLPLVATQISTTGVTTVIGAGGLPKPVTKQTVILTYQTQQYPTQDGRPKPAPRSEHSNARAASASRLPGGEQKPPGKYTFQTNQLPRPQYPAVKNIDSKTAKQVVNNTRKAGAADGWREGAGSAVSSDSGVWTGGESGVGEGSPLSRRRPRNLEMVMRGTHNFHLRELQVADLDIMDEAVVTGHAVIPLPKLPSSFEGDYTPEYEVTPAPTYTPPSPILPKPDPIPETQKQSSPMSTLERYRTRNRPSRIQTSVEYKDEEKFVMDRAQPEKFNKQNSFTNPSSGVMSPTTVSSSKESSPSCKSEESHFGTAAWQENAAGEAMATRSQDDVSLALSVSSCEDDKSKLDTKENQKVVEKEVPTKTIVIADEPPHPLLMKSLTLSQHDSLRATMMGSMTSSNYSTTSTCTNQSNDHHNLTLTLEESKFDISALETSTQSLLDDETSPADSLISSTSTSDSNNDLHVDRDAPSISSAYQTANTKTKSPDPIIEETDGVDGEVLSPVKEIIETGSGSDSGSKNVTPPSPGTPTHASGSLSLSDGRDFFDDEIADQPALLFRKNADGSPMNKRADSEGNKHLRRSRERITSSPLAQRSRKCNGSRNPAAERTPSLDTLSSLASDDLMMENDLANSITSLQSVDDYIERLDSSLRSGINSLDEIQLRQELSSSKATIRQWSQLLEKNNILDKQLAAMAQGKHGPDSLTASNNSLTSAGASLPVRTARLLQRSRTATPSEVASDGSASPAPASSSLLQDVVDIKTLLLQLKRVLQEPGEEHHSMSSETLDPLLAACAESPARGNGRRPPAAALPPDACAEMRRQILYLQSQLEERDRLVRVLQQQMLRMAESHEPRADDTVNVATQTDRLRPPMSTALTSSENSGLVSWNEQTGVRKLPSYSEAQKTKRPVTNGSVRCECGARKVNAASVEDEQAAVQLKTNSRVGTKYLQALAKNSDSKRYIKRDSSSGERSERKHLYTSRSRSIENFSRQPIEPLTSPIAEESTLKHHTSYGDLYNGRISSKESVNANRHSPSLNGQSTDTDYSSDGGYKSLPSSINYGHSPKKVSGIPRRSLEHRFISYKQVKASAV
ncbi:serine-rich adhesin for platelets [Battus philenor]|uniref:serine-rich adhesin for platelets n=1 Tax=Battus philenor TaxID=42288 RepID=UPI0035D09DD7